MPCAGLARLETPPAHPDPARDTAAPAFRASSPARRGLKGDRVLLLAMVVIAALPVWAFRYFPTTDGGAHVANADVLLQYFRPTAGDGYRAYYELNRLPVPNSLGHFVLALLMALLPALVAEKVFVTAYLLLLPLSVRYAACAVRRSAGWVGLLAVPLSLNWLLHQGFFNFLISVAIFFFVLGYWLRRREAMMPGRAAVLGLLGLLLYAGHLFSIMIACATIFILAAWYTGSQFWRLHRAHALRWATLSPGVRSRFVLTFLGLLPAIVLSFWFQHHSHDVKPGRKLVIFHADFWKDLVGLSNMISYRARTERPLALLLALLVATLFIGMIVRKQIRREWNRRDGLLLVPAALVALYFTRGDAASGQLFIPQRLVFYGYLTLLLFVAAQAYPAWARRATGALALLIVIGLTAVRWPAYRAFNAQMADFIQVAQHVEPGMTLLPLVFSPRGLPPISDTSESLRTKALVFRATPFYTAAGYAVAARHAIDLRNYEAGLDYFPVRYRPSLNPYEKLGVNTDGKGLERVPQRIDIAKYQQTTNGRVDYVLIWAVPDSLKDDPDTVSTFRQLAQGYTLVETSPSGRAQLWRRGH
jgi:hypothetical protein